MKLYAQSTSERASKGQGGNDYIKTTYSVGSSENSSPIANVELTREGENYTLRVYDFYNKEVAKIERTKGKRQKGESEKYCEAIVYDLDGMCPNRVTSGRHYCDTHKEYDY